LVQFPCMKITSLSDLNDCLLLLASRKENLLVLGKDWNQLLTNYKILCDLRSDLIEVKGSLVDLLLELERQGENAHALPAPLSSFDRYVILFCQNYFSKEPESRQAVTMHELGHFYVYRKELLEQLRKSRESTDPIFVQFIAPISTFYQSLPVFQKEWIKNSLFAINVVNILKIPGEIFANLWLKENFEKMFINVFKGQLEIYKLSTKGKEKIRKTFGARALIKFHAFSVILRLDGLATLAEVDYGKLREAMGELQRFRDSCWRTLQEYTSPREFETFRSFEKRIIKASCSLKDSNEILPNIFKEFVNKVPLRIEDFTN